MPDYDFDAVIFDLDGVITKTALVHSASWKSMFDSYLKERERKYGEPFKEFSHAQDYLSYVDGKPRYKGVASFLKSRNIQIPFGHPDDSFDRETICGIGNRKNLVFNETLEKQGVEVYASTEELIRELKAKGIRVGVASSSKNCKAVLQKAGLLELMETRVDGVVSAELGLMGKPEPDIFTTACDNLGVNYDRAVVVEDAVSGVQAGRKGNFGLVIGIAREGNQLELKRNGADIVVNDMEEIGFGGIEAWFKEGLEKDNWSLSYYDYDLKKEKSRESLLAVGNGYFGTRGAMEEISACGTNYPGTYMAGLYNRLKTKFGKRFIENEDLVNCPNWLHFMIRIDDDEWININEVKILDVCRSLDLKNGLLYRNLVIEDDKGRCTRLESWRMASMANPHLAAIKYQCTPLNYEARITIKTGIDGDLINDGVARYRELNQQHLETIEQGMIGNYQHLLVQTLTSKDKIVVAAKIDAAYRNKEIVSHIIEKEKKSKIYTVFEKLVQKGQTISIEKFVYLKKLAADEKIQLQSIQETFDPCHTFNQALHESETSWKDIWDEIDIRLTGDRLSQKLLRLHLYHLMISVSPHNVNIDASIGARGLHGEAYRGHIFWDELFILPLYDIHFPKVAKSLLMYRYRRLNEARKYAKQKGYQGAMYPWQSGSDGREETQVVHLNPLTGEWGPDYSSLQRHVSLAIAYNTWCYYWITHDEAFIVEYGLELMLEICRFWISKSVFNQKTGRYTIAHVMGPDEFHEMYTGATDGGLRDNAYTNLMVAWTLKKTLGLLDQISEENKEKALKKIKLHHKELVHWQNVLHKLHVVISEDGIISQFDGYFDLKELDWEYYRQKYGNIYRMDRILKAEGKSADEFKVAKQADTLMTFYNFDKNLVDEILDDLGYKLPEGYLQDNLAYYLARTSHGSTLSRVVHAHLAALAGDQQLSWKLYSDALSSDYDDIQGGTTAEGIHSGVMAGTVLIALFTYAGLNLKNEMIEINPKLPDHWREIDFVFKFRGVRFRCIVRKDKVLVSAAGELEGGIMMKIADKPRAIIQDEVCEFDL